MGFMRNVLSKLRGMLNINRGVQPLEPLEPSTAVPAPAAPSPPPGRICTICGQAPAAVLIEYGGRGMVWACNKKAHQARPQDRQELKKFKKLQRRMERRAAERGTP